MTLLMVLLFIKVFLWIRRDISLNEKRAAKILSWIFLVSTLLQLISRSPSERWNAIPASILAVTFYKISRSAEGGKLNV